MANKLPRLPVTKPLRVPTVGPHKPIHNLGPYAHLPRKK